MRTVIVTGGRDYDDLVMVQDVLNALKVGCLVQGGASGADRLAREWAMRNKVPCVTIAADWRKHGNYAGPMRNGEMLSRYNKAIVIAFPGGRGTADCVRQAVARNHVVLEVKP